MMYRKKCMYLIVFLYCQFFSVLGKFPPLVAKKAVLLNTLETRNCFVSYVLLDGKRFLVKQKKLNNKQISVVKDALAAYIASELKIAHQVAIVGFDQKFPGKIKKDWPATIHTIAPGDTVRKQRHSIYSSLRLKQWWSHMDDVENRGLTRMIIAHMAWHHQLPMIVALDLMIGNSDRHCGNFFYDPETDTFCAVDMDDTFNKDLCDLAYKKLVLMMKDRTITFSPQELAALGILKKTIEFLLQTHNPEQVIKKMYHFAKKAGFSPGSVAYTPSIEKKLNHYSMMIAQTWVSARKLITILNKLINKNIQMSKQLYYEKAQEDENFI